MQNVFVKSDYKSCGWNFIERIKLFLLDLKCCKDRITKGYCEKDLWSIDYWFLEVMPSMLSDFQQDLKGCPGVFVEKYSEENCHKEWEAVLKKMVFLLNEANEQTCKRINPYAEEHRKAFCEFEEKYGLFGEKLQTDEESSDKNTRRIHFMSEVPEYAEISEQYSAAEKELSTYQDQCKNEALALFSEWFWDLWD